MKTTLLAKSSASEPYRVEFMLEENLVRVFCHCQAGTYQLMCKHKLALIKGDEDMLFDSSQASILAEMVSSPGFAILKPRIDEYERKLHEIEIAKADLAKKEKVIKTEFAHGLGFGFK